MDLSKRVVAPVPSTSNQDSKSPLLLSSKPVASKVVPQQQIQLQQPKQIPQNQIHQSMPPQSEVCEKHQELIRVGYDAEGGKLVCNKCIFESQKVKSENFNQMGALFTPLMTKEIKRRFDQWYTTYKASRENVAEIEPEVVKEELRAKLIEFFSGLRQSMQEYHEIVQAKIRGSESLKELETLMEQNSDLLDEKQSESFDLLKEKFDSKITRCKFASIVMHKDFYQQVLNKLDSTKDSMDELFTNIRTLEGQVVQVKQDARNGIQQQFNSVVEDALMFDTEHIDSSAQDLKIGEIIEDNDDQAINKEQLLQQLQDQQQDQSEFSQLSMFSQNPSSSTTIWSNMRELISTNQAVFKETSMQIQQYIDESCSWVDIMKTDLYYQRIIVIPGTSDLYVIGGAKDFDTSIPSDQVLLVKGINQIYSKRSLNTPRSKISLTVARVQDMNLTKTYIFAIGGQDTPSTASRCVERYNTRADLWQQFPMLEEARAEASSVVLNDYLYVFGGISINSAGNFFPLKSIERLNLRQTLSQPLRAFSLLDVKLPIEASNLGIIPLSQNEVLLLGGFTDPGVNMDQKLKFLSFGGNNPAESEMFMESTDKMEFGDFFTSPMYKLKCYRDNTEDVSMTDEHGYPCTYKLLVFGVYYLHEIDLNEAITEKSVNYH